jgi:hypothetical protein
VLDARVSSYCKGEVKTIVIVGLCNEQQCLLNTFNFLTLKGPKAICRPFLKFGQAIIKTIFIKNS